LEFISAPVRLPWAQKGLDGRNAGTFQGLITATPTRIRESLGTNRLFKQHIKAPQAMIPATKMTFVGIKDPQEPTICGRTSSSSIATGHTK